MRYSRIYRLYALQLLFFACVFAFTGETARAAHTRKAAQTASTEIQNPIAEATVNLYCRLRSGKKIYSASGSGVFISERGVILTNAHVAQFFLIANKKGRVTGRCSVRTGSPAKERYTAEALYFPSVWVTENASELSKKEPRGTGENDFAVLSVTGAKRGALPERFPALPIARSVTDADGANSAAFREAITVAGYPTEKLNFDKIRRELPSVIAPSAITNIQRFQGSASSDVLTLAPSAAGSQGVSGGPVVDGDGEVVGIVTAKSTEKNSRTLRAITLEYIDRAIRSQTPSSLASLLSGDLKAQAKNTRTNLSVETLNIIRNGLLKKK